LKLAEEAHFLDGLFPRKNNVLILAKKLGWGQHWCNLFRRSSGRPAQNPPSHFMARPFCSAGGKAIADHHWHKTIA
jgi:hypothetical protein